ncbi:hypothetical protein CBR_g45270 [Chara braunii]|uniref:Uncharacterized protein n=1 Tax=Chara braunii TaxID=69332 RepID=A0A388LY78_CHABU|nr:hypothetical protein CBR_g45270 [Chara braunii]|eukprot:GBG87211.1 hypothetical protein CBR_g45270 [Chara braunii]
MERNASHLLGLLENFCKAGQTVFFFGKAHASVVWGLLRTGRNVFALENDTKMIDYLNEFGKTHVADTRNACEFVQTTDERNWDPKRDMYWKLPGNKRTEVWDFLFQPGPPSLADLEYSRRRNLVFGVLNGYHNAPRESVAHFLRRLEHVYFMVAKPLTLENYKAQFDEEDPFDAKDMEELSDSETFNFESMPLPRVVGQNDRLYFFGKYHRFTPEDVWGHNIVWHPRIFQPAVKNGKWVMAMKGADGKWSGMKRLGAGTFQRTARDALVKHLSLMNPERSDPDVVVYAEQKLNELYAGKMLEFRAPFYTLETAPSRGIYWRMPQPPSGGQHPGGGGGGDKGDDGGGGGDGSQIAGKGTGETSSGEKASNGKGSGGKDSGGKGSGGKGSGGKGSGGKCRTSGSPQYMETDPHYVGSRDSDMRVEATLRSDKVRVDSHLSARTLFPVVEESPSRRAQQRSLVLNTLLLKEGESLQHTAALLEGGMLGLRRSEGATFSSLRSGERHKLRIDSELLTSPLRPSPRSAPHATVPQGQENVTSYPPHLQLGTGFPCSAPFSYVGTRDWRSRDLLEGPPAGMLETGREEETQRWQSRKALETGGSEWEGHASKGASVDNDSESAATPGEMHALQREEETQHWPIREVVKGLHAGVLVIGTSEEVLHSRSAVATTQEGVVKGGQWTFVQAPVLGDDEGEEEPVVEAQVHGDEKGGEPVVEGGEVTVGIQTDPQRKDDDSSFTRCGEEQGDRPSVLSTGREMVLHEAIEFGNDSAATELV